MKKILLFVCFMCMGGLSISAASEVIEMTVSYVDPKPAGGGPAKSPIQPPYVTQNDNVLTFDANHADYVLTLLDEDGEEVYTTFVPSTTTTVVLPSSLTGLHEIQLYPGGDYYFTGGIVL